MLLRVFNKLLTFTYFYKHREFQTRKIVPVLRKLKNRQNIFLLIEPPIDPWSFPSKIGYSYMSRFTIDEDAAFQFIGVGHLSETTVHKHDFGSNGTSKQHLNESVFDDLESMFQHLKSNNEKEACSKNSLPVTSYFTPKLTRNQLNLVAMKNELYLKTFRNSKIPLLSIDVNEAEMKRSESKSKFVVLESC